MALLILDALRRPVPALLAALIALAFGISLSYFDQFLFLSPYLIFYLAPDRVPTFILDISLSGLSGIVLSLSVHQLRVLPGRGKSTGKLSAAAIVTAFVAGACPCYYMVPLLALAGGAGGVLGAIGILFYGYQVPIKFASVALMGFVTFSVERGLRASCAAAGQTA